MEKIEAIETYIAGHWLFVTVTTESGLTGCGEATYFLHPRACAQIVDEMAEDYRGGNAFAPEMLFGQVLKHHCIRDSALMGALSAIDQALWDIKGQALGVPVWQLLGGRVRDRVRAILLVQGPDRETLVRDAVAARDEGFTALKIKPFVGDWPVRATASMLREVVETVRAVRDAIGWEVDLAVEVHRNLLPADAGRFAEMLSDQLLYFIEDPVLPFSVASNNHVAGQMDAPTALAERNLTIWEFREFSDCHDVAFLRPDIGLAGGFTQLKKIAAIAESRHQRIVPHNFTAPIVTACHIQLAACTPNWDVQGYIREDRSPWLDVVDHVNRLENGFLVIPETPGIGMRLNLDYLRAAAFEPFGTKFGHGALRAMDGGLKHQ